MTSFEKKVYKVVLSIPLGKVRSYKWVAEKAGFPNAQRAVGHILKKNPFPLIIPCHRVVRNDTSPGGYAWGAKSKIKLLEIEKAVRKCLASKG